MKAVIVAAGMGSRLWGETLKNMPKTLLPFGDDTILSTIMKNISKVGIQDFVIVVGYQSEKIVNYLKTNNNFGFNISFVENPGWHKGNGISVLVGEKLVGDENFLLSMSDHIVSIDALYRIANSQSSKNLLLVDPRINDIFDIDDATKVEVQGNRIINIGKSITNYNGIDCGIFRLNKNFFSSMREKLKENQDSISAAVTGLIQNKDMEAVFIGDKENWIDIDTPEAYRFALENYSPTEKSGIE